MGFLLSLVIGFAPMLAYAAVVYWIDRYEKEPWPLVLGLFVWGAVFAAGASFVLNTLFGLGVYLTTGSEEATQIATGVFSAPLVEETSKGLAILLVWALFRSEFDTYLDGIVYGAVVGLGFAATENTYYIYSMGYLAEGWSGLAVVSVVRVVLF